jgi:diguanylate cyclase (GGDEF)-like protein/PAS domain S-box-containing protein
VSPSVERLTGYSVQEALSMSMRQWIHPDDIDMLFNATSKLSNENPTIKTQYRVRRKDNFYIWVEGIFTWVEGGQSETHIIAKMRDVTERKKVEDEHRLFWERSEVGVYRRDLDFEFIRANPALVKSRGYDDEQAFLAHEGKNNGRWRMSDSRRQERALAMIQHGMIRDFVSPIVNVDSGEQRFMAETAWIVRDEGGQALYIDGMAIDVTEKVAAERQLHDAARVDALTGLANRLAFTEAADTAALLVTDCAKHSFRLLFIDLDRFKAVNDTFGHTAGDDLIRMAADRLVTVVADRGIVARLGGDEFAVLLKEGLDPTIAEDIAAAVLKAFDQPFVLAYGRISSVSASIGLACFQSGEESADHALRRADMAMYEAKRAGRGTYRLFSEELVQNALQRQSVESSLQLSLKRQEIEVHFQPIVSLEENVCIGYETLARWRHPEKGLIAPSLFIPMAEQSGFIVKLGEFVIEKAIEAAARLPADNRIAVNASTVQLCHPDFLNCLLGNLAKHRVQNSQIEIEVTETALLDDNPIATETLKRLQRLGISVALDDFGTGWSSLSYLVRHGFDRIKIDRTFVQAYEDRRTAAVLRGIVDLAKRLGASLTAEGIETQAQRVAMCALGCDEGQGYLFGKPQSLAGSGGRLQRTQSRDRLTIMPMAD